MILPVEDNPNDELLTARAQETWFRPGARGCARRGGSARLPFRLRDLQRARWAKNTARDFAGFEAAKGRRP